VKKNKKNIYSKSKAFKEAFLQKNYSKALDIFQNLLSSGDNSSSILWGIAYCHKGLGQLNKAIEFSNKVILINPNHYPVLQILTDSYIQQGNREYAVKFGQLALQNIPTTPPLPRVIVKIRNFVLSLFGYLHLSSELDAVWRIDPEEKQWADETQKYINKYLKTQA